MLTFQCTGILLVSNANSEMADGIKNNLVLFEREIPAREPLSVALKRIVAELGERPVKFAELIKTTSGRGYELLLVLLGLPFLTPIPLPGLSTPFGIVIAFAGLRLAFGKKLWWPKKLLEKELPKGFFIKFLKVTAGICKAIEYVARPRLKFFHNLGFFQRIAGAIIFVSGSLLLLPLPFPFSNTLPAITIVLLAAGAMEQDGFFFIAGCVAFLLTVAYFAALLIGGIELFEIIFGKRV